MNIDALRKLSLIPAKTIVVGISGGPDSVALLHFLNEHHFPIIAAIFNHNLRLEAENDVIFVENLANSMKIPFVTESSDVRSFAKQNSYSIEEAARILRYKFLFAQARKYNAQAVAVGHTSDDQAETILMHLIRGSGLYGLKGMLPRIIIRQFDKNIPIIRPLLSWTRQETEQYCNNAGIIPRVDQTNYDLHFFRNKLRHELIPIIEEYNPNLKKTLGKTSEILQGDLSIIEETTNFHWLKAVNQIDSEYIEFNYQYLTGVPIPVRRHLFRRALYTLNPDFPGMDFDELEKAQNLDSCSLSGGFEIERDENSIFLLTNRIERPNTRYPQVLSFIEIKSGENSIGNNWYLELTKSSPGNINNIDYDNNEPFKIVFDTNRITGKLILKNMQKGDRIKILGLEGHSKKISDIFIDNKIPKKYRTNWPVLSDEKGIIWIAGLRESEIYKITQYTTEVTALHMFKK